MPSSRKLVVSFCCCLLFTAGGVSEDTDNKPKTKQDSKKKGGKSASKDKGKPADPEAAKKDARKMSFPLPEGHDAKVLVIPYRDGEAKKTMNFTIGNAHRTDADHVQMSDLQVETFDEAEKSEMTIDLPSSVLDLNTRVISTQMHVTIKRDDFEITGETMEFNTETKQGSLGGNVRMLIYNLKNETEQDAPVKPKEEPKAP